MLNGWSLFVWFAGLAVWPCFRWLTPLEERRTAALQVVFSAHLLLLLFALVLLPLLALMVGYSMGARLGTAIAWASGLTSLLLSFLILIFGRSSRDT